MLAAVVTNMSTSRTQTPARRTCRFCLKSLLPFVLLLLTSQADCQVDVSSILKDAAAKYSKQGVSQVPGIQAVVFTVNSKTGVTKTVGQGVYGVRRLGRTEPLLLTDPMRIGSCTKSFVSYLAGLLVQQGRLQYSDSLGGLLRKTVPEMKKEWDNVQMVELLSHTAGVMRDFYLEDYGLKSQQPKLLENSSLPVWQQQQLLARMVLSKTQPGSSRGKFRYSNAGADIASLVVTTLFGQSLEALFAQFIAAPLGLKNTSWAYLKKSFWDGKADVAYGYYCTAAKASSGQKVATLSMSYEPLDRGPGYNPEGGLNMAAPELAKWLAWHMRGHLGLLPPSAAGNGSVPSMALFKKMHTLVKGGYALMWENTKAYGSTFWHSGLVEGFSTSMTAYMDGVAQPIGIVLATNYGNYVEDQTNPCFKAYDAGAMLQEVEDSLLTKFGGSKARRRSLLLRDGGSSSGGSRRRVARDRM